MVTFAIGAEKYGEPLIYVEGMKDAYPFPKYISIGKYKTMARAHRYMDAHEEKLKKLLERKGYGDYELSIIRIDAPHVVG